MTTFYCIRHGKTEFNQKRILQGGLVDSPLLPEGVENAKKVGLHLQNIPFTFAFSSPQKRAENTAQNILNQHSTEIDLQILDDLREMEFGNWDGLPESNFYDFPEYKNLIDKPHLYNPSSFGGESFQQVINRGVEVFQTLTDRYPNETILIVSHGLTLQSVLKYLNGTSISEITTGDFLDNTSLSIIKNEGSLSSFNISNWNDTSFLA